MCEMALNNEVIDLVLWIPVAAGARAKRHCSALISILLHRVYSLNTHIASTLSGISNTLSWGFPALRSRVTVSLRLVFCTLLNRFRCPCFGLGFRSGLCATTEIHVWQRDEGNLILDIVEKDVEERLWLVLISTSSLYPTVRAILENIDTKLTFVEILTLGLITSVFRSPFGCTNLHLVCFFEYLEWVLLRGYSIKK